MGSLDSAAAGLPKDGPVVIITASYEGTYDLDVSLNSSVQLTSHQVSLRTTPVTSSRGLRA
jgi:hypothetical protein